MQQKVSDDIAEAIDEARNALDGMNCAIADTN
jgi:hypothetical protein